MESNLGDEFAPDIVANIHLHMWAERAPEMGLQRGVNKLRETIRILRHKGRLRKSLHSCPPEERRIGANESTSLNDASYFWTRTEGIQVIGTRNLCQCLKLFICGVGASL